MANHVITFENVTFVDRTEDGMILEFGAGQIQEFVTAHPQFFGRADGLIAVHKVYATEDDEQDDDVKMFISIDLQIEIDDDEDPYDVEPIEDLLDALSHRLFGTDRMDFEGWEVTDYEEFAKSEYATPAAQPVI